MITETPGPCASGRSPIETSDFERCLQSVEAELLGRPDEMFGAELGR